MQRKMRINPMELVKETWTSEYKKTVIVSIQELNFKAVIAFLSIILITQIANAQQQYQPIRYYTFDDPSVGYDQMNNGNLDFQYYGSGYTVNQGGQVDQYLTMGQSGSLVKGGNIDCQRELTIEFLFRPGHTFNNTEFIRRRDKGFEISFDQPDPSRQFARMKFKTKYKDNSGNLVDDNMSIDFDGIGVKSWGYYTDGNWHHMVFKFNGNTGTKEIWVDGQLASGFTKAVPPGIMEPLGQPTELWFNNITSYRRLFGDIDEFAIYTSAIPAALIYKHYLEFLQGSHYSWINNYTQPIPPAAPVTAGIDINEYAPGHPTPTVNCMVQLRAFPTPRYKNGHTLLRNFQWFDPGKLAGYQTTNNTPTQIRRNVLNIQKELAGKYHYFFLVQGNTIDNANYDDTLTVAGASVKLANQNPQWPTSAITFWPQINPTHAGYTSTQAYIYSQTLPANYYLKNSSGQFMSQWGGNTSTKFWSPAGPRNYNQYDGQTQRFYMQKLLNKMTRPLDIINENAEVIPLYPESTLKLDPAVVADKNASGKNWAEYQGYAKARASIAYRNEFMNLPGLSNTIFTEYGIDGQPTWRHNYSEARKINTQINGQYYSTPDFYVRWPSNWRNWTAAWHGWQWIVDSRKTELSLGDKLYSPFVGAGWNLDPERNVRPAQWLGLLKTLGATGAEFYYTGFFAESNPLQNPDNWIWQIVMPPYAQAITSRYEDILRNGHLMDGDVPAYNEATNIEPGYSFYAGDYRKLIVARKHNNKNKYAITGSVQPSNNMIGSVAQESDAKITLDGQEIQFKIRRQGSTYIYDNTDPVNPVFYQLDGWHEYKHPYLWTKDFNFEAELFDNNNSNLSIKTQKASGSANGDFRNCTSYLKFQTAGPAATAEYNFSIRENAQNLYLWVRARSSDGTSTGIDVELDNGGTKSIGCIDSTGWAWYRYDACNQQAIRYLNTGKNEHTLKLTPLNTKIEIDQIVLTVDQNLILDPSTPNCSATIASISSSGSTTFCTGDSVTLTASQGTSYLWLPSGDTTQSITVKNSGTYSVLVGLGTGCSASAPTETVNVIGSVAANITANGSTTICQGDSVVLTASSASTYSWIPGGETTQSITVSAAGSYSVMVTDSNGCSGSSASLSVSTFNNNGAQITANGPTTFCAGNSVTLSAPVGATYQWSNGETSQSIIVNTSGTYAADLIYGSGCAFTSNLINVVVNTPPPASVSASGPLNFCNGSAVTLSASTGSSYLWTPGGATTQSINVSQTGAYSVQITDNSGCSASSNTTTIIVFPDAVANINASGPTSICPGQNVLLTATPAASYQWSNGSSSQSLTATASGSYNVTVTNANGCTAISPPVQVNMGTSPDTSLSSNGPLSFCQGENVVLSASAGNIYNWSNGATSQSITVANAGSYFVTLTNTDGCSSTSNQRTTNVLTTPSGNIGTSGPANFCPGNTLTLTAPVGDNYIWLPNGETSSSIIVDTTGSYSVQVTNNNGCSLSTNAIATNVINSNSASINSNGNTTFCSGDSVILTATAGASYLWSDGQTTQSIVVLNTSNNLVTVTFNGGCNSVAPAVPVTVNQIPVAVITANGSTNVCQGTSVVLTADPSYSYLWSTGETTQSISVNSTGNYYVTVANNVGCSKMSALVPVSVTAIGNTLISTSGSTNICQGNSVSLSANAGLSYIWSNGATTQSITTGAAGSYAVTVDYGNGCSDVSPAVNVTVMPAPNISLSANGPTIFCDGNSVQLNASGGSTYYWHPTGATTNNISVTNSGIYSVIATDNNGCSAISQNINVSVLPVPDDSIYANGSTTLCQGSQVSLFAGAGYSYQWTTGANTQFITVDTTGSYAVTVTHPNGCSITTNPTNVSVNPSPSAAIVSPNGTSVCAGDSIVLSANNAVAYLWSNGETTQNIYATSTTSYAVTVSNNFGCTASSSQVNITQLPSPIVSVSVNGATSFCEGDSVLLTASQATSYTWYPSGQTTQSIVVKGSGQYYVVVGNSNGCQSKSQSFNINVTPTPAVTITAAGPTKVCDGDTVFLSAPAGGSWLWSSGATTQNLAAVYSGNYIVTVNYGNGCNSVSPVQSVVVNRSPFALIQANGPLSFCDGDSVVLTSNQAESYLWIPTGDTTQTITVKQSSAHRVQTTTQGCSNISTPTAIQVSPLESPQVSSNIPLVLSPGGTITLSSSPSSSYNWYPGGQQSQSITVNQAGTYFVTTGNPGVCMATSDSIEVFMASATFNATINSSTGNLICAGDSVLITASQGSSYNWFPGGQTSRSIYASHAGTYYCVVHDPLGSGPAVATIQLQELEAPKAPDISSTFNPFTGYTLTAYEPTAIGYLWSTGETTTQIVVSTPGTYSVKAFNSIGCESSDKTIIINTSGFQQCVTPDMLQANSIGLTFASLEWNPALTAEKFEVSYWKQGTTQKTHFTLAGNQHQLFIAGLSPATTYEWTVKSICMSGLKISAVNNFTTLGSAMPCGSTPINLSNDSITKVSAYCNWHPTIADSFIIKYRAISDTGFTTLTAAGSINDRFKLESLAPGTTYEWNVTTRCSGILSLPSVFKYFTTQSTPVCDGPKKLNIEYVKPDKALITWNLKYFVDSLQIFIREKGTFNIRLITLPGNPVAKSVLIDDLKPEKTYHVWVRSVCSFGNSSYSNVLKLKTPAIPGFYLGKDLQDDLLFNIYPVPVFDILHYAFFSSEPSNFNIRIVDELGKLMYEHNGPTVEGENKGSVNVQSLRTGAYIIKVEKDGKHSEKKFIKF